MGLLRACVFVVVTMSIVGIVGGCSKSENGNGSVGDGEAAAQPQRTPPVEPQLTKECSTWYEGDRTFTWRCYACDPLPPRLVRWPVVVAEVFIPHICHIKQGGSEQERQETQAESGYWAIAAYVTGGTQWVKAEEPICR